MRVLVYKRTHNGDPDARGRFGIWDCMGTIRDRDFDAVIGVGGIGVDAIREGIAGKVNWVGIGPHRRIKLCKHGTMVTIVTFDYFIDYSPKNVSFRRKAPALSERMYDGCVRHLMVDDRFPKEFREAKRILDAAKKAASSNRTVAKGRARMEHREPCT